MVTPRPSRAETGYQTPVLGYCWALATSRFTGAPGSHSPSGSGSPACASQVFARKGDAGILLIWSAACIVIGKVSDPVGPAYPPDGGVIPHRHKMTPSSSSIDASLRKLARAEHHFRSLERSIEEFLDGDPYSVAIDFYADRALTQPLGRHLPLGGLAYLALHFREHGPVPMWWAPLVGDFLQNLRSSLDQLVRQLVDPGTRSEVSFPISLDRDRFEKSRALAGLRTLDEHALAVVRAFQPYQRPRSSRERHPLWILRSLLELDHRRVLGFCGYLEFDPGMDVVRIDRCRIGPPERIRVGAMKHGAPLVRFLIRFPRAGEIRHDRDPFQVMTNIKITSPYDVALDPEGAGTGRPVLPTLREMLSLVRDTLVPSFRQFYR